MTSSPADDDALLAELLENFSARLQTGEPIDVDACARQHPEIAERLRRLLPAAQALANLSRPAASATALAAPPTLAPLTGTLGDFRIEREVGRGGMGVVYEAEQISLGRRVALKVLPFAAALAPRHQRRFQNEARAAACLHHPNIVPVYAVGADRGVHYYAMQFIEGQTLATLIQDRRLQECPEEGGPKREGAASTLADRKSPGNTVRDGRSATREPLAVVREVARLGVQAAEALDHAHGQGVMHRDIKPANLMLDAEGRLWVTDFGLAHIQGDSGLTMTGDLLGTVRYMSPEQALARRELVDHRTDLYSLGVTLYELLTLRPAVPGEDRQELLQRIAHEEPVPARRLNPAVPADLETVLSRAMAKEPAERYATARELADDLQRFLDDRPVLARRPTLALRLRKWARRHRALVGSLALSAALLLLGGVFGLAVYAVQQREAADEHDRVARANEQKKREAEGKLYRALLAKAAALRRERQPGYRRAVWDSLSEAADLRVATDGGDAVRTEVLACLGDAIGLDPVAPAAVARRSPPEVPPEFRRYLPPPGGARTPPWAVAREGYYFAHLNWPGGIFMKGLFLWNKTHQLQSIDELPLGAMHDLAFTPDGGCLILGCEEGVISLSVPRLQVVTSFRAGTVRSIAVHPGGRLLATGGRQLSLWSLTNHRLIASFPAPVPGARVEFSADGRALLAVVAGKAVAAWPVADTPEKRCLEGHQAGVPAVAFSPDGKLLVSVSKDRCVRIWDAASGKLRHTCRAHGLPIEAVAFSPDGKLLASGDVGGTVWLWAAETGERVAPLYADWRTPPGQIWRLQFSEEGSRLVACGERGVAAWDIRTGGNAVVIGPPLSPYPVRQAPRAVFDLAVHPGGHEVAFLDRLGRLYRWKLQGNARPERLDLRARLELRTLHFDRAGERLTFLTPAGTLGVADWPPGGVRDTELSALHLALGPGCRWVATADAARRVVLHDLEAGKEAFRLPPEGGDVWCLAFSPDGGRLAVGLSDGGVAVWDLEQLRDRLSAFGLPAPQPPFRVERPSR